MQTKQEPTHKNIALSTSGQNSTEYLKRDSLKDKASYARGRYTQVKEVFHNLGNQRWIKTLTAD